MLQFPMRWSLIRADGPGQGSSPVSHTPTLSAALDHTADHLEWYLLKFPKETNALNWTIVASPSALWYN